MNETTAEPDDPAALPLWWWARGLTLCERTAGRRSAVEHTRTPGRGAERRPAYDGAAFAARLASLRLDDGAFAAVSEEPADHLGARSAKPSWAERVERAVAAAPTEPAEPTAPAEPARRTSADGGVGGPDVFRPVLRALIVPAVEEVATRLTLPEREVVLEAFEAQLGGHLARLAARTLVKELNLARAGGRLSGASPRDRFAAFTRSTGTADGLARLFTRYPTLARLLGEACANAVEATVELTDRLAADRHRLGAELFDGVEPGALRRLELGYGDSHAGNRFVAILHFAAGRVVYKPRPLDQHVLLDEIVDWLGEKVSGLGLSLDLSTARTVQGDGYGWREYVEHRWCASVAEAERFYRRQGVLLALLYAINGTDMHYENVIASGDQPILVDVETLLHPDLPLAGTAGPDPAAEALRDSVHGTGLLPQPLIGQNGALDVSALGRSEAGTAPSDGMRWEASGTDEMRVVRGPVASPAGQNQPLPAGRGTGHADHRAALLEGFRAGYEAICRHRAELLARDGILARLGQTPARLIVRPTRLYAALLDESLHPDLLSDALARDAVFALLWTESAADPARGRLIEEEIAGLWRGDVPLFLHRPAGTAIWTDRGTRFDAVLPVAGLAAVRAKIAAMSEADRRAQEWIIEASLAVGTAADRPGPRLTCPPASSAACPPSRLLAAARAVADDIAARAVRSRGRANWLGLERVAGRHWALLPMGGGFGEGYSGVALFLAEIGALTGARRYTSLAAEAVRPLAPLLAALAGDAELSAAAGPGALSGLGGLVYALVRLSALLGDEAGACVADALVALEHAARIPCGRQSAPADLADGLAGALVAAVAARHAPGAPDLARRLADRLLVRAEACAGAGVPGFARGEAGIGWALLRYAQAADGGVDAKPHAVAGARLLRSSLDRALAAPGDLSWHSGLAGSVLAAGSALDPAPDEELDRCVRLLTAGQPAYDQSLYQGSFGLLEPLLLLADRGHAAAGRALARRTGEVLGLIEQRGACCATPGQVPSPGLFSGLSGIGYALLRLGFPEVVPSVLLFAAAGP